MSIEQQPPKSNKIDVNDMPSLDRTVVPPKEHRDDKNDKKLGWKKPAAAVALLGAVAAGAFGGMKAMGGDEKIDIRPTTPTASAPANPGETEAPQNTGSEYAPVELTVERYQDGDALIRAYNAESNKWVMSGVDKQDSIDWADPEGSIRLISQEYDEAYIDALFVSDWQERPQLQEMIATFTSQHEVVLNASIMTTDSTQPEDKEPYEQREDVTMTEVVEATPDQMVVSYRYEMWSNADQNRGDMYIENVNGREGGSTVTFLNENGVWKISDIKYLAGE